MKTNLYQIDLFSRGVYNPKFASLLEDVKEDDLDFQGLVPEV